MIYNPDRFFGIHSYKIRSKLNYFLIEGLQNIKNAEIAGLEMFKFATEDEDDFFKINSHIMKKITGNHFIKYIGIAKKFNYKFDFSKPFIILNNIVDFGNLGSIIRTCYAFDFHNVIINLQDNDYFYHKVFEASKGMIFHLKPALFTIEETIDFIKNNNLSVICSDVQGDSLENYQSKNGNFALVFGNETNGISQEFHNVSSQNLTIPSSMESLNVSVAAGIMMFHIKKYHEKIINNIAL